MKRSIGKDRNTRAFLALVKAGLWERDVELQDCGDMDFAEVFRLGEEQAVLGLVAAGLDHVKGQQPPKEEVLKVIGKMVQLEQRNSVMNRFIGELVSRMREKGIYTLLVKGQGVAQCYERPLWRSSGDIDFFLSDENYAKADAYLLPLASSVEKDTGGHHGMTIDGWVVELHNSLHCGLSKRIEKVLDKMKRESFYEGKVRSWMNGKVSVFLLSPENEILYGFCHFLKHFYKGGLGLRQICDWCRLLWTYRSELDVKVIEARVKEMGLMSEWKAFGAFAVEYLGMPIEAMPLFLKFRDESSPSMERASSSAQDSQTRARLEETLDPSRMSDQRSSVECRDRLKVLELNKYKKKADRILDFVMMAGNFGHNRDMSYQSKYPYVIRKFFSMRMRIIDLIRHSRIFPLDSLKFFPKIISDGVSSAMKGY